MSDPVNPTATKPDFWSGLGAGTYEAANQFGMGLPDFLINTANSDAYNSLKRLREQNPEAAMAGGLAGSIGSMFIPGFGAVKGLQTASKLGNLALQGGAMAAKQAIPRALTATGLDVEQGKDLGQSAMQRAGEAGIGTLAGALANPAVSKIGESVGKLAEIAGRGIRKQAGNALNLGLGATDRDIESKLRELAPTVAGEDAYVRSNIRSFQDGLAQYLKANKIDSAAKQRAFLDAEKPILDQVAKAWDANPPGSARLSQELLKDPYIAGRMASNSTNPLSLLELRDFKSVVVDPTTGKITPYWQAIPALDKNISTLRNAMSNSSDATQIGQYQEQLKVFSSIRNAIQSMAKNLPGVSEEAKNRLANWKYRDVMVNADTNNAAMQSASNTMGEGSFSKFGNAALGTSALGALGGAGIGSMVPGDDKGMNPLIGGLAGVGASLAFPKAIPNIVKGIQSRLGSAALPTGAQGAGIPGANAILSQIRAQGKSLPSVGGTAGMAVPAMIGEGQQPVSATPVTQTALPSNITVSQAPVNMGGEMIKLSSPAKVNMESPFGKRILGSIDQMFKTYHPTQNGQPMNRQQMLDYFFEQTGGFEPKNASTIKLMTNNPQEQQELGSAIPKLGQLKEIDFTKLAQKIVLPFDVDAQNSNNMYVRLLAELNSKDPAKIPTSQEISQSQDMVNKIKFSSGSDQQKRQDFLLLLSNRGFPLDKLKALGLTEGLY